MMIITFGYLLASHIPFAWKTKRQRLLGCSLIIDHLLLIITGYLLYYASNEIFRLVVSYSYFTFGIVYPFILGAHIYSGILAKKKRRSAFDFQT